MQKQKEIGPFHRGNTEKRGDPLRRGRCNAETRHRIPVPAREPAAAQLPSPAPLPGALHCYTAFFFLVIYSLFHKPF